LANHLVDGLVASGDVIKVKTPVKLEGDNASGDVPINDETHSKNPFTNLITVKKAILGDDPLKYLDC
jgi:hypothetical protein